MYRAVGIYSCLLSPWEAPCGQMEGPLIWLLLVLRQDHAGVPLATSAGPIGLRGAWEACVECCVSAQLHECVCASGQGEF